MPPAHTNGAASKARIAGAAMWAIDLGGNPHLLATDRATGGAIPPVNLFRHMQVFDGSPALVAFALYVLGNVTQARHKNSY